MNWINNLRLRARLSPVPVITATLALVGAGLLLSLYDTQVYKTQKMKEVMVQARTLAASAAASFAFNDTPATQEYLNALRANPEIDGAAAYDHAGKLVASYTRTEGRTAPLTVPDRSVFYDDTHLIVVQPVVHQGDILGSVYVRAMSEPLVPRLLRYGAILLLVVMASLIMAVLVTAHSALTRANQQLASRAAQLAEANANLLREIEEREKAEEALRQSQKMEAIGQLTGGIAHDFNNMLAVIMSSINMLIRRVNQGNTDIVRYAEGALEGARRAALLTQQLLAFSRRQPLAPVVIEPNKLVLSLSELFRRTLGEHIKFETVIAGGLWPIYADKVQLENALLNLAVNARDAMPEGGTLTLETANAFLDDSYVSREDGVTSGQYVMIAVSDTGIGMTPDVIAKAFEPFFTTKAIGQGTGLGLSQVYGFVRQSRGHVRIYSEVGQGTSLKIYLPRHVGDIISLAQDDDQKSLPSGSADEVILVVEDDERLRLVTVDSLRELGYTVCHAATVAGALELIDGRSDITLIFTDIVMPDGNGRKLAEEALKRRPALKVLYTTGYTRNAIVHNGVLDHGVHLISKPFSLEQLATKVRDVLAKSEIPA